MRKIMMILALACVGITAQAQNSTNSNEMKIQKLFQSHFDKYKDLEYYSGATLSIALPGQKIKNYYRGYISRSKKSKKVTADTLFQIGSITKSFTAVIMLQLEAENKLNLDQPLKTYLPTYPKWGDLPVKSLLNMTSGIPNYTQAPRWNSDEAANLSRVWTDSQLIEYVYPKDDLTPPLKTGYFYSNTNYILSSMIIEKLTKDYFQNQLIKRTIKRAGLGNTFYLTPKMDVKAEQRLANGYSYNQYDNPMLLGVDVHDSNLSLVGAAGAVISNSEDIIKWVSALFVENTVLTAAEKSKLSTLISTKNGKSIKQINDHEKEGFGLGVVESYEKGVGRYWNYEGQTMGYRAMYIYVPCNGVILSTIFNSATNSENDHIKQFILDVYKQLMTTYALASCH